MLPILVNGKLKMGLGRSRILALTPVPRSGKIEIRFRRFGGIDNVCNMQGKDVSQIFGQLFQL